MKRILFRYFSIILLANLLAVTAYSKDILKLATTTSTYETGILEHIFPPFENRFNIKIHIISVGSGKAIKLGENGDVDIILVHAREAEEKFVQQGFGVNRRDVMYNDFIILGPQTDSLKIAGSDNAANALKKIYETKHIFISRGDDSGTDKKEKYLWKKAGINSSGDWYLETGQGMSATLRIADEKNAYVIIDRATYLFNKNKIHLKIIVEGEQELFNPYGVIAVSPYKHAHVNYELSMALIGWLTSPKCQQMIADYKINGRQLFYPSAAKRQMAKDN